MGASVFDALFSEGPIRALQDLASPLLDTVFLAITATGGVLFLLAAVVLLYWLGDKRFALFVGLLLLTSWAVNGYLKAFFGMPRPPSDLHRPAPVGGYGLPSGHAQQATAFWAALAAKLRGPWVRLGATMVPLVALSRVYLGVHFVGDVLAGAALGLGAAGIGLAVERLEVWDRLDRRGALLLALLGPAALGGVLHLLGHPIPAIWGLLTGLAVGYVLEGAWVDLSRPGGLRSGALRVLLGVPVVLAAYVAIQGVAGYLPVLGLHAALGLLVALVLPWNFAQAEAFLLRRGGRGP